MPSVGRVHSWSTALLRYRWAWSLGLGLLGTAVRALASTTAAAPWSVPAAAWYDGAVGTYAPYAGAAAIIGSVLAYRHMHDQEGLMLKLLTWGVIIAVAGSALAYTAFWGAPVSGMTLDELNIPFDPFIAAP